MVVRQLKSFENAWCRIMYKLLLASINDYPFEAEVRLSNI
jgi:hypothetical protein